MNVDATLDYVLGEGGEGSLMSTTNLPCSSTLLLEGMCLFELIPCSS